MQDSIIARKYATALFNATLKTGVVDKVADDLGSLGELMAADPRFLRYLESPQESTERKRELLVSMLKSRVAPTTFHFLNLIVDKKRTPFLPGIVRQFQEIVRHHHGIVKALVTTAVPLDADQGTRLRTELGRLTGKTIEIEPRVDPAILGGVIVAYENQIIDQSVRRGLDDLRDTLMKVRVL
jgi:F-type H+-transporting ATPase subunit delta